MTLRRLPDSEQCFNRPRCPDPEHNPPGYAAVPPGSYLHTCPTCGNEVRIEVSAPMADPMTKQQTVLSWSKEHRPVPGFDGWHYALGKGGPCWYVALDSDGYTHAILTPDGNVAASRAPAGIVRWLLDNAPSGEAVGA